MASLADSFKYSIPYVRSPIMNSL